MRVRVGDFKLGKEEKEAIMSVLDSGRLSEGPNVRKFELEWAKFVGTKYSVLTSSGTAALMLGLTALQHTHKIKKNSTVITTPLTYIATSNAILMTGYNPAYVDVDMETFNITPDNIKTFLESHPNPSDCSMILPVHLMGYACDMDKINKIAKEYGLLTFEDSAQAHGTEFSNGKKTGSMSLLSDFSFYIAHNIQAGELGAINTDDPEIYKVIRKLKSNGRFCDCPVCTRAKGFCPNNNLGGDDFDLDPRFLHDMVGYNFKTMEFQAALGLTQLKKADFILKKRQENVKYLNENLQDFSDIVQLPKFSNKVSYLAYPLVIKDKNKITRKKLRTILEKKGIENRPLFGSIPTQQPAYSSFKEEYQGKLPNADYLGQNGLYVGCHQYLEQDDIDYMIKVFKEIFKGI